MAFLLARTGTREGVRIELDRDVMTLGRAADNDVIIEAESVSGHHAKIWKTEDGYRLADLNSTNGTFVNGERITECALLPGAVIVLGQEEFVFEPAVSSLSTTVRIRTAAEGAAPPSDFTSVSPYRSRYDFRLLWTILIIGVALAALIGLGFLAVKLLGLSG